MGNHIFSPRELHDSIIEVLVQSEEFKLVIETIPLEVIWINKHYHLYVKNISSAFFKDRPDSTRAQLAYKDTFQNIVKTPYPFIFLGYDAENDVLINWDPRILKLRLNERKSISLYSKVSYQKEVKSGNIILKRLKNKEDIVLFKRKDLPIFFDSLSTFFKDIHHSKILGKIESITDERLLNRLRPLLNTDTPKTLEAIKVAQKFYVTTPNMKFLDWLRLIKSTRFS